MCTSEKRVFNKKNLCNFGVVLQYCIDSISVLVSLLPLSFFDVISANFANKRFIQSRK